MKTNKLVLFAGIIVLVIAAIFVLSRRNTTIAPEKMAPGTETSQTGSNGLVEGDDQPVAMQGIDVEIKGFAFSQPELRVKKGATVTWKNEDSMPHTVTASDNSFDSGSMAKSATFSHTFNETGTFDYSCTFHPNMKAKIIVE